MSKKRGDFVDTQAKITAGRSTGQGYWRKEGEKNYS